MVARVTRLSHKRPYGAAMLVVPGLLVVLANVAGGPIGDFFTLFFAGAAMGAIVSAWSSMIAASVHPLRGQSRREAFFSAELERWAREGLAVGSIVGLALAVLDAWVLV
jgi:hypothetical protein